jgi:hypothetical protein
MMIMMGLLAYLAMTIGALMAYVLLAAAFEMIKASRIERSLARCQAILADERERYGVQR